MLAIYKDDNQNFMLMQSKWASVLNPIIKNPSIQSIILKNVQLSSGDNTINHMLNRTLTGWRIIRIRSAATIYDKQDTNAHPDVTLVLNSSASVSVDLEVL